MGLEVAVRNIIAGDEAIEAIISDRIRPLYNAATDVRPCLVYTITNSESIPTFTGTSSFAYGTVEVATFTDSYAAAIQLSGEIKRLLNGYSGISDNTQIVPSKLEDESDVENVIETGTEKPVYVRTLTFRMFYRGL